MKIQTQSLLYNNKFSSLKKSLETLILALEYAKKNSDITEYNIIYGDNSPIIANDETIDYLKSNNCGYKYFNQNNGTAVGHNLLAKESEAEWLVVHNPDIVFCYDSILNLYNKTKIQPLIKIVESRQTPIEHAKCFDLKNLSTSWASTACTMICNKIFKECEGFDESFFMYCDDVDLSWRFRHLGYNVIYAPDSIVFHDKRLSNEAKWIPTDAEKLYSAEAGLIMANKWGNDKLLEEIESFFSNSDDSILHHALINYRIKASKGVIKKVDNPGLTAVFDNGFYSPNRY
jgi:GT2 family glycosyltransferase